MRVAKDEKQAIAWYRKAADQDAGLGGAQASAQTALGIMYQYGGDGVTPDRAQAIAWYRKAADQGDTLAKSYLDAIAHNYVMEAEGEYGYQPALSQNDINAGKAAKSLVMFRYGQRKDGTYVVAQGEADGARQITLSCKDPCNYIKSTITYCGRSTGTPEIEPRSDSIGSAVMDDAVAGYLKAYSTAQ